MGFLQSFISQYTISYISGYDYDVINLTVIINNGYQRGVIPQFISFNIRNGTFLYDYFPCNYDFFQIFNHGLFIRLWKEIEGIRHSIKRGNILNFQTFDTRRTHKLQIKIKIKYLSANW